MVKRLLATSINWLGNITGDTMPEIKAEEVKSELKRLVEDTKSDVEKQKLNTLPPDQRKAELDRKAQESKKDAELKAAAEAKAKQDEAVLAKKPEERTDDEKKRADEIAQEKAKSEEAKLTAEEKIKRVQDKAQERINEVINEMKQLKDKSSKEFEELTAKLTELAKQNEELEKKVQSSSTPSEVIRQEIVKAERERINKYLDEDKDLPRERRREMSKSELEEWMLEDLVAAQEWMTERNLRRKEEKTQDFNTAVAKIETERIVKKQKESLDRILAKDKDLADINSEKSKLMLQVIREKGEEFKFAPNAPELFYAELERRVKAQSTPDPKQTEIDALRKEMEELKGRLQNMQNSDTGINSVQQKRRDSTVESDGVKRLRETMAEVGASAEQVESAVKKYKEKHGE